jgi:hypothetical protein
VTSPSRLVFSEPTAVAKLRRIQTHGFEVTVRGLAGSLATIAILVSF